jgi:hypothetical protein
MAVACTPLTPWKAALTTAFSWYTIWLNPVELTGETHCLSMGWVLGNVPFTRSTILRRPMGCGRRPGAPGSLLCYCSSRSGVRDVAKLSPRWAQLPCRRHCGRFNVGRRVSPLAAMVGACRSAEASQGRLPGCATERILQAGPGGRAGRLASTASHTRPGSGPAQTCQRPEFTSSATILRLNRRLPPSWESRPIFAAASRAAVARDSAGPARRR